MFTQMSRFFGGGEEDNGLPKRTVILKTQPGDYAVMVTLTIYVEDDVEPYQLPMLVNEEDLPTFLKVLSMNKIPYSVDPLDL